jgi:hypothetical protein
MKYIKYFESINSDNPDLGISLDEIEECFYEMSDSGWIIKVKFDLKLFNSKIDKEKSIFIMDKIPFIEILIIMKKGESCQELLNSDIYYESISRLEDRLKNANLYIKSQRVHKAGPLLPDRSQIVILVSKKEII